MVSSAGYTKSRVRSATPLTAVCRRYRSATSGLAASLCLGVEEAISGFGRPPFSNGVSTELFGRMGSIPFICIRGSLIRPNPGFGRSARCPATVTTRTFQRPSIVSALSYPSFRTRTGWGANPSCLPMVNTLFSGTKAGQPSLPYCFPAFEVHRVMANLLTAIK
jgi:hypothetical protein